jgi:hypothetical protein
VRTYKTALIVMLKPRFSLLLKPAAQLMLMSCLFPFVSAEAGEIILPRSIDWPVLTNQTRNGILYQSLVTFDGALYNRETKGLPVFAQLVEAGGNAHVSIRLRNEVYEPLTSNATLQDEAELKQHEIFIAYRITSLKKKPGVSFQMIPLRRNAQTGRIEKLVRFDIVITYDPVFNAAGLGKKPFVSNSVLASGDWYKIAITHTGIHALSKSYLKSIGINVDAIDPRTIKIYGTGGGMLPQKNAIARFDDLPENAIAVEGESDGVLNDNDRILFFARSQKDVWKYNAGHYEHITNIYDDVSYYFITYGGALGKRIQQQAPQPAPNTQVSEFDQYYAHEEELSNLIKSGRRWMGEEFSRLPVQNFQVNMGKVNTSKPVYIRSCVTAHSFVLSTFTVAVNSSPVITHSLPPVDPDFTKPYATDVDALKWRTVNVASGDITVSYNYNQPIPGSIGWLDFFELNARCALEQSDPQMLFRDSASVGSGKVSQFNVQTASVVNAWDITFPASAVQMSLSMAGGAASFVSATDTLREFISFTGQHFYTPVSATKVENQNLHGLSAADMFIITHPQFVNEAQTLAQFHRNEGKLKVHVVLVGQIYNEFSSGAQDLCAIRDFLRLFYKRAATVQDQPKYVTLFGRASYDYKNRINNNTNYVPTYESVESFSPENSYCSDDFIGFLDDQRGIWDSDEDKGAKTDDLDIAIGRLPAQNNTQAQVMVNKIINYITNPVFGDWKTRLVFVADDGDWGEHQGASENVANKAMNKFKGYNVKKIYIDAFKEQNTSGGARNPDAQSEIVRAVEQGAMIINYAGHGGEVGWAGERILNTDDIQNWTNGNRLPLFFTATCEFSRFDDPERTSAGEMVLLNPNGGGIALFTTVRLVNTGGNRALNNLFYNYAGLDSLAAFNRLKLGEIFMLTKNAYRGTDRNERNFTLLGDPAMQLAYPTQRVVTTSIDQQPLSNIPDTIKAFEKVTISGKITDIQNNDLSGFSGVIYPSVYDKTSLYRTLGSETNTPPFTFAMQNNLIYRGKASVVNGNFSFSFIVPKDISYEMGYGRISYAADNGKTDAAGYYENIIVGNTSDSFPKDEYGPEIRLYMNDEHFVYGGITNENPTLIVKLADENGMNITGKGVGRDISMIINHDHTKSIVLNDFYQSRLDSYKEGEVLYKMKGLSQGKNVLTLRAYDIYNNSSDAMLEFVVATSEEMALYHVLNYPNPFTTNTTFHFDHNKAGETITVQVQVYTISGKLIKTLQTDAVAAGNHFDQLSWDGRDDYGDHIGKGVYIYKVKVKSASGKDAEEFQKLVVLN